MSDTPKVAYIFPGQGAQEPGMGKTLYEAYEEARARLDRANELLGRDLTGLMFDGPKEELDQTNNCQPAILAHSAAALAAAQAVLGDQLPKPDVVAGLSLGEYTALMAAGVLTFDDAVQLVCKRGQFMQDASDQNPGGMCSIIALSDDDVEQVCKDASDAGYVVPANFNCPGQVAVSGEQAGVDKAAELAKERGAKMAVHLDVAGAFHSKLMEPAAARLAAEIERTPFRDFRAPVVANVTADVVPTPADAKQLLVKQLMRPVMWAKSMQKLIDDGVDVFYEIGPGKVLSGLMRRIDRTKQVIRLGAADDLAALAG